MEFLILLLLGAAGIKFLSDQVTSGRRRTSPSTERSRPRQLPQAAGRQQPQPRRRFRVNEYGEIEES